jgi:hypothetical protein
MRFARILEHGQEYLVSLRRGLCGAVRHIEEQCYLFYVRFSWSRSGLEA